ncbi:hypothetical protein BG003_000885 [Podila horticola]|nr:hypothetical protein BG003_000885 [Podila horticola]
MGYTNFKLTVTSTSTKPEHLMVILNPKLIADHGVIYQDYFPVAWHVLKYPPGGRAITRSYDSQLTAILQEVSDDNIVSAGKHLPADAKNNVFNIVNVGGDIPDLQPQNKCKPKIAASIYNSTEDDSVKVGLGDKNGRSYLTLRVPSLNDLVFTYDAEFAIVPVGETLQDQTKMVTGTVHAPWYSFKLSELTTSEVSLTFDGKDVKNVQGLVKITEHLASEDVFGPSEP